MAVAYQSSGTRSDGAASTSIAATGTLPTGTVSGDLLVAQVVQRTTAAITGVPSGWNIVNTAQANGTWTQWVYWKIATGSETGSYTWTSSGSAVWSVRVSRFTGHDPTTPVEASNGNNSAGASVASINVASINYSAGAVAVFYQSCPSSSTFNALSGYTERYQSTVGTQNSNRAIAMETQDEASAGSTGTVTTTITGGSVQSAHLLSIAPPAAVAQAELAVAFQPISFY